MNAPIDVFLSIQNSRLVVIRAERSRALPCGPIIFTVLVEMQEVGYIIFDDADFIFSGHYVHLKG